MIRHHQLDPLAGNLPKISGLQRCQCRFSSPGGMPSERLEPWLEDDLEAGGGEGLPSLMGGYRGLGREGTGIRKDADTRCPKEQEDDPALAWH